MPATRGSELSPDKKATVNCYASPVLVQATTAPVPPHLARDLVDVLYRPDIRAAQSIWGVSERTIYFVGKGRRQQKKSMPYMLNLAFFFTETLIKLYAICKSGFGT